MRPLTCVILLFALWCGAQPPSVPVGTYLYADMTKVPQARGSLTVKLAQASTTQLVVAWGHKNRKDRQERAGTTENERQALKPRLAELSKDGGTAVFPQLPPDFYDLIIIDPRKMTIVDGLTLQQNAMPTPRHQAYLEEITKTLLGKREDKVAAWEGFFDSKQILCCEYDDEKAGVLLQQMRLGKALAESGAVLEGTIHSVDVVWLERAKNGQWQVLTRQQLYRGELPSRDFFCYRHEKGLSGLRIVTRPRTVDLSNGIPAR